MVLQVPLLSSFAALPSYREESYIASETVVSDVDYSKDTGQYRITYLEKEGNREAVKTKTLHESQLCMYREDRDATLLRERKIRGVTYIENGGTTYSRVSVDRDDCIELVFPQNKEIPEGKK